MMFYVIEFCGRKVDMDDFYDIYTEKRQYKNSKYSERG